jgi:hypothetical protein
VTLPVVWIPEANKDLQEARDWYGAIRPELGDRFALAVETTVDTIAEHALQFPGVHRNRRRRSLARTLWHILRGARSSDCGDSLLPRQAQSEALAIALALIIPLAATSSKIVRS